jgi:hypothetical protein
MAHTLSLPSEQFLSCQSGKKVKTPTRWRCPPATFTVSQKIGNNKKTGPRHPTFGVGVTPTFQFTNMPQGKIVLLPCQCQHEKSIHIIYGL